MGLARNPHNVLFTTLLGATAKNASAPAAVAPPLGIIPEKVMQHHHKAQGRFGGTGTVPSDDGQLPTWEILQVY